VRSGEVELPDNVTAFVAQAVVNGTVQPGPPMNPFFDQNLTPFLPFGINIWLAILGFVWVMIIIICFFGFTRRNKLAPVLGYGAAKKMAGATEDNYSYVPVILFEKVRTFRILCLKHKNHVFQFPDDIINIRKWVHTNADGVLNLGGLRTAIANDDYVMTRDIVAEMALTYGIRKYNEEVSDSEKIFNYETFKARFGKLMHRYGVDGIRMPTYGMYDPSETTPLLPEGNDPGTIGGVLLLQARKYDVNADNSLGKLLARYGPLGLVVFSLSIFILFVFLFWK
jgi:hypothetical protein